jgi:hypothetical protein
MKQAIALALAGLLVFSCAHRRSSEGGSFDSSIAGSGTGVSNSGVSTPHTGVSTPGNNNLSPPPQGTGLRRGVPSHGQASPDDENDSGPEFTIPQNPPETYHI